MTYENIRKNHLESKSISEIPIARGNNLFPFLYFSGLIAEDSEITEKDIISQSLLLPDGSYGDLYFNPNYDPTTSFFPVPVVWFLDNKKYLLNTGTWISSNKSGIMRVVSDSRTKLVDYNYVYLWYGWNLKVVSRNMVGKSLLNISGDCIVDPSVGVWNNTYSRYNFFNSSKTFTEEDVGTVLSIKVGSNCKLGDKTS